MDAENELRSRPTELRGAMVTLLTMTGEISPFALSLSLSLGMTTTRRGFSY